MAVYVNLKAVADSRDPHAKGLDLPGMAAFTAGAGVVTYALIRAGENGWTSAATLGLLGVAWPPSPSSSSSNCAPHARCWTCRCSAQQQHLRRCHGRRAAAVRAAFSYLMYVSLWLQSVEG
ncbi:hypothetical protein ACFSNO_29205 [Streptomyces cirratus]